MVLASRQDVHAHNVEGRPPRACREPGGPTHRSTILAWNQRPRQRAARQLARVAFSALATTRTARALAVGLPLYPDLTEREAEQVIETLVRVGERRLPLGK